MKSKEKSLIVFEDKKIRRIWHDNDWCYSIVDVVQVLEVSTIAKRYWSDLKAKLLQEGFEAYDKIVQLKLPAEDGKLRVTDCANTKNMFRIIQSIPPKRAEPFKQELTEEWKQRGVEEGKEFAILTNEISKATFGVEIKELEKKTGRKVLSKTNYLELRKGKQLG